MTYGAGTVLFLGFGGMQTHPGAAQAAVGRTRPETAQDAAQATVL
jgi:hypothetical protein